MKRGWEMVKLGEVLKHRKDFIQIDDLEKYKLCRVQTSARGVVLRSEVLGSEIRTKKQQICKSGDFLVAEIDAKMGGYGLVPEDLEGAIVSSHYFLYDIIGDKLDKTFFEFFTQTPEFFEQIKAEGSTNYAAIRPTHVLAYEIPLPPLSEQQRMAGQLTSLKRKIDAIRRLREEQEKKMKGLLLSQYQKIIEGSEWKPMKEVAPIIRRAVPISVNDNYPELGIRSFGKGTFQKPSLNGFDVGTKRLFRIEFGDLIFSNVFAWEGAIAVAKKEDDGRFGSHRFISCVCKEGIELPEFLCFHFLTRKGMEDINAASPGGAGRNKTLGLTKLEKTLVPVPDMNLQKDFLELQSKMETLRAAQTEQLAALEGLFPALLDQAFQRGR